MDKYKTWFINLKIPNRYKIELIKKYNNEENIYNNINIENEIYSIRYKLKDHNYFEEDMLEENLFNKNIKYITYSSELYPKNLREIDESPYVLFYRGDINLINSNMVAIVGSRRNTSYGEQVTKIIAEEISKMPYGIVSGVAAGIDSIAQKQIIESGGKTIGVLGCGIDVVYPRNNKKLYDDIIKTGLLISEFLPGTKPFAYNFPRRNRIISGLSKSVIVIEASMKSGSLITVNYALEQNKNIMAVPGSIFNQLSKGCNRLIYDGATPFLEKEDLYTFLNITKKNEKNKDKNSINSTLLGIIGKEPIHIDKIIESVNIDRIALFELLFEMQNRNEIICLPGNYYANIS